MLAARYDIGGTVRRSAETQDLVETGHAGDQRRMRGEQDLRAVDGGQRLEDGFDGPGVNAILGFFNQVEPGWIGQVGEQRQCEQPKRPIGN